MEYFSWPRDEARISEAIRSTRELLRVIIKTRDEEFLLERWIRHYLDILGKDARIILLDNMSSGTLVHEIYEKYSANLIVVKFEGNFDAVHIPERFKSLYEAIWDSSKFYAFFDTDEFLFLYDPDSNKLVSGERILEFLEANDKVNFFSNFWLRNQFYRDDVFNFSSDISIIQNYVKYGKPIINSKQMRNKLLINNITIHTLQLPISAYCNSPLCFVMLHKSHVSRPHRIKVNLAKLAVHGVINSIDDYKTLLAIDTRFMEYVYSPTIQYFIKETRTLIEDLHKPPVTEAELSGELIRVAADGTVSFLPPELEHVFRQYARADRSFFDIHTINRSVIRGRDDLIWLAVDENGYRDHFGLPVRDPNWKRPEQV